MLTHAILASGACTCNGGGGGGGRWVGSGASVVDTDPSPASSFKNIHTYTTCMLFWDVFFSSISKDVLTHSKFIFLPV